MLGKAPLVRLPRLLCLQEIDGRLAFHIHWHEKSDEENLAPLVVKGGEEG